VAFDDGIGAVVDDAARNAAEVRERPAGAVPERGQIHAGRETGERVPRVRHHHVERVDLRDADMGDDVALVAPVDLRLCPRHVLEPAMQPAQRELSSVAASSAAIRGRALRPERLDPLVTAGKAALHTCGGAIGTRR
jgi:hypothetical protein